jgi:hypothetical protein
MYVVVGGLLGKNDNSSEKTYRDLGDAWIKDLERVNADEAKYLISILPLSISRVKK